MGALSASKNKSLLARETKNAQERRKPKGRDKRNTEFELEDELYPSNESSGSKKEKHQRFDKGKCSCCKKGNHIEKGCMKCKIDQMSRHL